MHEIVPGSAAYRPTSQLVHSGWPIVLYVPGSHALQPSLPELAPSGTDVLHLPPGHGRHSSAPVRFDVAEPAEHWAEGGREGWVV